MSDQKKWLRAIFVAGAPLMVFIARFLQAPTAFAIPLPRFSAGHASLAAAAAH